MLKKINKSYTLEEAKKSLENFCAYQERCHQEIENKMWDMGLISQDKEQLMLYLLEHDYLNEERFSKAYARGKFRIKKWGKQRIIRELNRRNISKYNINKALLEINELDYLTTFDALALKKTESIKEKNIYKKRKKLADYLLYRGWESNLVYNKIKELIP